MNVFGVERRAPKGFRHGTDRACAPADTLARLLPTMARFGVTRLADVTGLDSLGIPVYVAVRPASRSLSTSQGKGLTRDAAKASALMESIECWHAERIERPVLFASARELRRRRRVMDLSTTALAREATFDEEAPLLWLEGWDVIAGEPVMVPFDTASLSFTTQSTYRATFLRSSNGLASGNDVLEALAHGVLEVIERDAQARFDRSPPDARDARRIDLGTVDDEGCREVMERIERGGARAAAWDVTSDVGVPTFVAQVYESPDSACFRPIGPALGYGCHLSPAIALLRALTEAAQCRLTLISGSRDDTFEDVYEGLNDHETIRRYWEATESMPARLRFDSAADASTGTFEGDLAVLEGRLRSVGVSSIVAVDLAKPEIGVPVVKVLVPGLEPDGDRRLVGPPPARLGARGVT